MDAEKWKQIKEVFGQAVELDEVSRAALVGSFNDETLRREVKKLLVADAESAETFLETASILANDFNAGFVGKNIGGYEILREIGRGGMGTVFLAERADLKQKVALKIIRQGIDSEMILRRFRREQEILAALEHPNIARLLDAGIGFDNSPFLVMEYVEGKDLLEFCRENDLSVSEKLVLFRKVCAAVSYAHSRLVVHRDLKPSNILINENGEPKLLDFGISKLISETGESENKGTVTSFGMLTPNYASPEQFRGETVSTATDVYSLGVILYELLTGVLPYEIDDKRLDEAVKIVCEIQPKRPSAANTVDKLPAKNSTDENGERKTNENSAQKSAYKPAKPDSRRLKGDIDNIILKSLRKEPRRRYASVERFADDLRRHLEGLTVSARPDTFAYRAEKFVKRNRALLAAGLLILLVLLGGIAASTFEAVRAERQRQISEKRFNQVRELANNVVFKYYDKIKNLSGATEAREMLVTDATLYLDNLAQDAGDDISLQRELAKAYMRVGDVQGEPYQANLGNTQGAIEDYRKAISLLETAQQKSTDLETRRELRDAYQQFCPLLLRAGDKNVLETARRAARISEQIVAEDSSNAADKISLAKSYVYLGDNLPLGDGDGESIPVFNQALSLVEPVIQNEPANKDFLYRAAAIHQRIGFHYSQMAERAGEIEKLDLSRSLFLSAAPHYQFVVALMAKLSALEPENANYKRNLALSEYDAAHIAVESGEIDKALPILLRVLKTGENAVKDDAGNVQSVADLSTVNSDVSLAYLKQKNFPLAIKYALAANSLIDEAVRRDATNQEYKGGQYHVYLLYGDIYAEQSDYEKAIAIYRNAFKNFAERKETGDRPDFKALEANMHQRVGNSYLGLSKKTNLSAEQKQSKLKAAQLEYEKALELLQTDETAQTSAALRNADVCTYLIQKINSCKIF